MKRIITCDNCTGEYAVYGLSQYCPWCGKGNLKIHFQRNVGLITKLLTNYEAIYNDDKEAGYLFLGDNLENCVGLFEGYLKQIYSMKIKERLTEEEAELKIKSIGNKFQNISRAQTIFREDLDIDILKDISPENIQYIQIQFSKRHLMTHNLGLVDEKYLSQVESWQKPGQEVPLDPTDITRTLEILNLIILNLL